MKAKLLFLFVSILILAACKKEKAETKPNLNLVSTKINNVVFNGSNARLIEFEFEILDKEADVRDSFYLRKEYTRTRACSNDNRFVNLQFRIPEYPATKETKLKMVLKFCTGTIVPGYQLLTLSCPAPDTSLFRFWVKDNAGNISDTVVTEQLGLSF
jgi:hypothetical protein